MTREKIDELSRQFIDMLEAIASHAEEAQVSGVIHLRFTSGKEKKIGIVVTSYEETINQIENNADLPRTEVN